MNDFLSKQTPTNLLLIALIVLNIVTLIIFTKAFGKMQKTLNYIDDNTGKIDSSLGQIEDNTKYLQYK